MLLVATTLFISVLLKSFRTGLVPNFPTMIVSGFIAIAAIISWFSGRLLATIAEKTGRHMNSDCTGFNR